MTEWLSSIGPAVGNHLWQSTAFAAVVWLATLLLRRNQAGVRYGLWLAASMKFLVPFSLLVGLGSLLPKPQHVVVAMPVSYAMDTVAQPFTETPMDIAPVSVAHVSEARSFGWHRMAPEFVAGLWLCGVMGVLAVWSVRWRQVAKTLRQAVRMEDGREAELLRRVGASLRVRRQVPLLMSQKLMEPGMFGIFRPVLIWPERLSERLDDEHIEAILAHELGHAQRRDNLTAVLHMVVEAAFWFYPLVWWMERRMVEERERACDEAVVEMGSRPETYAESLLKACRFCVESPLVCVSGITGADLAMRVRKIMTLRLERLGMGKKVALALFGIIAIATPILLGQSEAAQRMMLAAANAAPIPFRAAAREMIAEVQTPSTGEIAEVQANAAVSVAAQTTAEKPTVDGAEVLGQASVMPVAMVQEKAAQTNAAVPSPEIKFDVVSFKPYQPGGVSSPKIDLPLDGDYVAFHGVPMQKLLLFAYGHSGYFVVSGEPEWVDSDRYDFQAKVAEQDVAAWQAMSLTHKALMVRALLEDTLKLKVHPDTAKHPIYDLVVAKRGPKMQKWKEGDTVKDPQGNVHAEKLMFWFTHDKATCQEATMADLVNSLSGPNRSGRVVVDKTGLTGKYNFTLPIWYQGAPYEDEPSGESIFTAVESLGLRLVPDKGTVRGIVVDHIERPPEN
ncbi:MAG: TIGR03435 family protein [Acidobacteriaceae bacterium]